MQNWRWHLCGLAAALWWGSLTALFIMAPLLFAYLPSHTLAGNTAAHLFTAQSWISSVCAVLLLMLARPAQTSPASAHASQTLLLFVILGLLLALLVQYAIAPRIVAREHLAFWHTLGSLMLVAQWACALAALWRLLGPRQIRPA
ncbi:MAG: DUF4149 domain-containing protein [Burkholderiaceae bacterium]|jgi:hypothetical protein|nr:DUF4149 domain-containing protein [Burkholderiaceae bacterium]